MGKINSELQPNTSLAHYRIVSRIGAGGMGEVYLAEDTRLNRKVAIKLLPSDFAKDQDRIRRFELEARATSALNHPNILTVHDIGSESAGGGGAPYIVSELLEGEELREQLNHGALPVRRALDYAQQIAAGLAAAHEKGIVHRDLKPENLFVTKDGRVKILDFGLAKLKPLSNDAGSHIATQDHLTNPGVVMGTVAYMSPQQVRGEVVDHRSDIFSFGTILYEMLTGKKVFLRETMAETMTAILKEEPEDVTDVNSKVPPHVSRVVRNCLSKKPEERFQSAHDLKLQLQWIAEGASQTGITAPVKPQHKTRDRLFWSVAGFAIAAIAAALLFWLFSDRVKSPSSISSKVKRFSITIPDTEPLALAKFAPIGVGRTAFAISPDGTNLVYAAERNGKSYLFLRALDQFEAKIIPGTEGSYGPFFSPDGRSLAFFSESNLKRVSLQGGEPVTICEARIPHGGSWGPDDMIIFADSEGSRLSQVSASGGAKKILLSKWEDRSFYPEILPGGKAVLFSVKTPYNPDYGEIALLNLETGERKVVFKGGTYAKYAPSGHLIFARAGAILAAPFDLKRLEVSGPAVTVIEGMRIEEWGAAQFAFSQDGTLIYMSGAPAWIGKLTLVDLQGNSKPLDAAAQAYGPVRTSPDGQRVTVPITAATSDIWIYEFTRGTFTRLTTDGSNYRPVWTPDGKRLIYFRVLGPNQYQMVSQLADGSDAPEPLWISKTSYLTPGSCSPDGKLLAFQQSDIESGFDLHILPLEGDRKPYLWLKTNFNEWGPAFSRDGKWIAYVSDESGQYEIYVRPVAGSGGKRQISNGGGEEPAWSHDGRTLFYRNKLTWMSVAVQTQPEFQAEVPKAMFEGPFLNVPGVSYDVMPDGQHFIMVEENQKQAPTTKLNVVLNWLEELQPQR